MIQLLHARCWNVKTSKRLNGRYNNRIRTTMQLCWNERTSYRLKEWNSSKYLLHLMRKAKHRRKLHSLPRSFNNTRTKNFSRDDWNIGLLNNWKGSGLFSCHSSEKTQKLPKDFFLHSNANSLFKLYDIVDKLQIFLKYKIVQNRYIKCRNHDAFCEIQRGKGFYFLNNIKKYICILQNMYYKKNIYK